MPQNNGGIKPLSLQSNVRHTAYKFKCKMKRKNQKQIKQETTISFLYFFYFIRYLRFLYHDFEVTVP